MTSLPEEAKEAAARALCRHGTSFPTIEQTAEYIDQKWPRFKEEATVALTAALPFLSVQGAVKKLEWRDGYKDSQCIIIQADTLGGFYQVRQVDGLIWLDSIGHQTIYPTLDAAKSAAQADYEARILSALEPSAARELALEALRSAEQFIENGFEFGFIRKPDEGDTALETLPKIKAAIRSLSSPDHADGSKSTSDQKVCQTCNDRGIIGGMYRVGDGDVDGWEEPCPDCQKVKAHHSDADTGPDDLVQIALHLNCDPDADSILHVIREIQADLDIAKHADAGKVEGDGWSMSPPKFHRYPYFVENISGKWCLCKHHGNGSSHTISVHETAREARDAAPASEGAE